MKIVKTKPAKNIKYVEIMHDKASDEVWASFNPDILDELRERFPKEAKSINGIMEVSSNYYGYVIFDEFGYLKKALKKVDLE
jgi:hypothetical protein